MKAKSLVYSVLILLASPGPVRAQSTSFTYQGRLEDGVNPATGRYDLRIEIFDDATGGSRQGLVTNSAVAVSNGLFTTTLDFGSGIFTGANRWLELAVRTNGGGAFATLAPRQVVLPTPYAMQAASATVAGSVTGAVPAASLMGSVDDARLSTNVALRAGGNTFTGPQKIDGPVGIGLSSPSYPLEVQAAQSVGRFTTTNSSNGSVLVLQNTTEAPSYLGAINFDTESGTPGQIGYYASNALVFRVGGAERMTLDATGLTVNGRPALLAGASNQPLEFLLNSASAWRLLPNSSSPNIIGGYAGNVVSNGVVGAFIGGGGSQQYPNRVTANYGAVLGGFGNVAGGVNSTAFGNQSRAYGPNSTAFGSGCVASNDYAVAMGGATVASGPFSTALGYVTQARGYGATAMGVSSGAFAEFSLCTGYGTAATGACAVASGYITVAGGAQSFSTGYRTKATGHQAAAFGTDSLASGENSLALGFESQSAGWSSAALGHRARALHDGSFVWSDQQTANFDSTGSNQFNIRASGGVRLNNDTSLHFGSRARQMINLLNEEYGIGVQAFATYFRTANEFMWYAGGRHSDTFGDPGSAGTQLMRLGSTGNLIIAGTLSSSSDRNVKEDFAAVDPQEVLAKVAALPIQSWSYTNQPGVKHVGPMAQDFRAAFGLGEDDKHIATVDADGVALAAIQGLNHKLEAEVKARDARIAELEQRLATIEALLKK